jgi:voltage-gated potassium channel
MSSADGLEEIRWNAQAKDGQVMLSLAWEVFVLGVAILSIVNLALGLLVRNPDSDQVVVVMDGIIMIIFSLDLVRRLNVADDNRAYLTKGYGWVDAISIIPLLRITRLLRIVRVVRVMGRMGGPRAAIRAFFANRAAGGLLLVLFVALLVLEFGSIAMLWAERSAPDALIVSAEDALWYVIVTMSTVGYGDFYPVTSTGRVIGSLIIVVGVGVFGTLTGFLANMFLTPSEAVVEPAVVSDPEDDAHREVASTSSKDTD